MMHKPDITVSMITNLIKEQFPEWSHLLIKPVEVGGHDNRTFHLGERMSVRLPSAEWYAAKVKIEQKWLPFLAPYLSTNIPTPIALGQPSKEYPFNWSVYHWIEGTSANILNLDESGLSALATSLAKFLNELHVIDSTDGPVAGPHNFYRGGNIAVYDAETRSAVVQLQGIIDTQKALTLWEKALSSQWTKKPVWIHGDLSAGNILIHDNRLAAVIDFGGMGIGDPACDLIIAWTLFHGKSREIFKEHIPLDPDAWARACGWALWKSLITLAALADKNSAEALKQMCIIKDLLHEFNMAPIAQYE